MYGRTYLSKIWLRSHQTKHSGFILTNVNRWFVILPVQLTKVVGGGLWVWIEVHGKRSKYDNNKKKQRKGVSTFSLTKKREWIVYSENKTGLCFCFVSINPIILLPSFSRGSSLLACTEIRSQLSCHHYNVRLSSSGPHAPTAVAIVILIGQAMKLCSSFDDQVAKF